MGANDQTARPPARAGRASDGDRDAAPSADLFRQMFDRNPAVKLLLDPTTGLIVEANAAACRFYGYPRQAMRGLPVSDVCVAPVDQVVPGLQRVLADTAAYETHLHRLADGEERQVEVAASRLETEEGPRLLVIVHDVSERAEAEHRLEAAVAAQRVLLRETHHRVKNNLQLVSSLLSLQGEKVEDPTGRRVLEEIRHRVRSMALVHELLHQGDDALQIRLDEYLGRLVRHLYRAQAVNPHRLVPDVQVQPLAVDLDRANPLGLIVNELVTNALLHAWPGDRSGRLQVSLTHSGRHATLSVADDGVGLPPGFDAGRTETLGLQLVLDLVDQLDGTFELERRAGTRFTIRFPL